MQLLGPNGILQLGTVNQFGEATDEGDARAAAGAVSDQGAISVGGSGDFPANADLNLTPLLTGTEAESILSALSLNLGAVLLQR